MRSFFVALLVLAVQPSTVLGQSLDTSQRDAALERLRSLAECVERSHIELQRLLRLVRESEEQQRTAREPAVRRDAERAIEALLARAAEAQDRVRECSSGERIPNPAAEIVERPPLADPAAEAIAQRGGTVRVVEENSQLTPNVRIVRGEQVDGEGRVEASAIRAAVRQVASRLERCYDHYLDRGDLTARELDLVFTLQRAGPARQVRIERSGFGDARLESCVQQAGRSIRVGSPPQGGPAIFSYRFRFGR